MTEPLLRTRSSGFSGSGYKILHLQDENGRSEVYPGVTTITGILDKPALYQYHADSVAAKAVISIDQLLNRTESEGFNYLRWEGKYASSRAASIGSNIHLYVENEMNGVFPPSIDTPEVEQMVHAWNTFRSEHTIEPLITEGTVINRDKRYGGTLDGIALIDGIPTLYDLKSSRFIYPEHYAQLAALGAADELFVQNNSSGQYEHRRMPPEGWESSVDDDGKITTRWDLTSVPDFSRYAVIHIRYDDYDNSTKRVEPAFCKLEYLDQIDIDDYWDVFLGCLDVVHAQRRIRARLNEENKRRDKDVVF